MKSRLFIAALMTTFAAIGPVGAEDIVHQRGGNASIRGEIQQIDDVGVTIRAGVGEVHELRWDMVRDIEADRPPTDLAERLQRAEDLWRASTRLQRGDGRLAESLFARLFEHSRGRTDEVALLVAEGLLRCRLMRSDLSGALIPALETIRQRRAGISVETFRGLQQVLDADYDLCPYLPPAWIRDNARQRLAAELDRYDASGDDVVAAIARLYRLALQQDQPFAIDMLDEQTLQHPGVALLHDLVATQAGDVSQRKAARERLRGTIEATATWAEAWIRYSLGTSLLGESNTLQKQQGAVHLSHLPARFSRQQPFLAGLAVAALLEFASAQGHSDAALALRRELEQDYHFHPIHYELD